MLVIKLHSQESHAKTDVQILSQEAIMATEAVESGMIELLVIALIRIPVRGVFRLSVRIVKTAQDMHGFCNRGKSVVLGIMEPKTVNHWDSLNDHLGTSFA